MSELYGMVTVAGREQLPRFTAFYQRYGVEVCLVTVGTGTAASEILDAFGLEKTEKAVSLAVVTDGVWKGIKQGLQEEMGIDVPGTGIAFVIPLSSIGGKKPLLFLTEHQNFVKGEESALKDTKYELVVIVANRGYTEPIMAAARGAGAGGGTVIHARGLGLEGAEKFLGVSLAADKEVLMTVVRREDKNAVMRAVMEQAGLESKMKSVVFSLPVTSAAGMRLQELDAAGE